MVPFVGLTGGIGAGKSTALAALSGWGRLCSPPMRSCTSSIESDEVRDLVVERFGSDVAPDGTVDRAAVARSAFATAEDREWLEHMLWPRVGERMVQWRSELEGQDPAPAAGVVEVPLLFESGMDQAFDATIAVIADEEVRARPRRRPRPPGARRALGPPAHPGGKGATSDLLRCVNDGSEEQLEAKLSEILAMLTS